MEFIAGVLNIAVFFLAVVAGILAISMLRHHRHPSLKTWSFLIIALALFSIEEILGVLKNFKIYYHPYLTHIIPTFILIMIIFAIFFKISNMNNEKEKVKPC